MYLINDNVVFLFWPDNGRIGVYSIIYLNVGLYPISYHTFETKKDAENFAYNNSY